MRNVKRNIPTFLATQALLTLALFTMASQVAAIEITFTTGPSDPANGMINATVTPATFVDLGGLGFDLAIDNGTTGNFGAAGDLHLLGALDTLINFEFFVTGTSTPIAVTGVTFRVEDVETTTEALTDFTYTDAGGVVQSPLFTDSSIFTPDAGTIIDMGGSRFYHPVGTPGIQLDRGITVDLSATPIQAFSIARNSGGGGDAIGPSLGDVAPAAPALSCDFFDPPMHQSPVTVKGKKRALPLKAELLDDQGNSMSDLDIVAAPVVQVLYVSSPGDPPVDVTGDVLPVGQGTDGNQFEFSGDRWRHNLKTTNFTASGSYFISMESGNETEYLVDPTCQVEFVIP